MIGEEAEEYKYCIAHLGNRLDQNCNSKAVWKNGQSKLCFLGKLRSFMFCSRVLHIFCKSAVQSVISSAVILWGVRMTTRLSVLWTTLEHLDIIVQKSIFSEIFGKPLRIIFMRLLYDSSVFCQRLVQITVLQTATGVPACPQSPVSATTF